MDNIYGNVDYELSRTPGNENRQRSDVSDCDELSVRESNLLSSRGALKILLAALSLLLFCAFVTLCALGAQYSRRGVSLEAVSEQYARALERLSVQEQNYSVLKSHLDEVQLKYENVSKQLDSCKELISQMDEVQVNYEKELKCPDSFNDTGRKYEALKVKDQRAHEVFSNCSECQNCTLCGEGWRSFGGKCYYFSTNKLNWMNSRDRCAEKGGHLVIITSRAEQSFVSSITREPHWIGLNDLETEGKWMWVNNQTLNETGVEFWFKRQNEPDEPDNWKHDDPTGENCAALGNGLGNTHVWFDASCRELKKYICEK